MIVMHGLYEPLASTWGAVILLMQETGWSWPELNATPAALVGEMLDHIAAKRHWTSERLRMDAERRK